MPRLLPSSPRRTARRRRPCLRLEQLEARHLLSATWPGLTQPQAEVEVNDTLDQAQALGTLGVNARAGVVGAVGNGPAGAADVDFYRFSLSQAAHVHLATLDRQGGSPLVSVLSLYDTDPQDLLGYHLVAQDDGAAQGGDAVLDRDLGPGTYYVAVSGSGDRYFNPLIADSGYDGSTGAYGLQIVTSDIGLTAADGPAVLATDPAPGATLLNSPLLLRLDVSGPIDRNTLVPGSTVQLTYSATGNFNDGTAVAVPLAGATFDGGVPGDVQEIQVTPAAPLAPGFYQLTLAGNQAAHGSGVVCDPNGVPLGTTLSSPLGQDYTLTFQVAGIEGTPAPAQGVTPPAGLPGDDTAATAHQLGDVTAAGLVHVAGTIGDDPTDPVPFDPNDVDLYHFQVSGGGSYSLGAEVFAGRIGSPLDPALTLFRQQPDGSLTLVATNYDTGNPTLTTTGYPALLTDAALHAALTAGDYYLAVSSGFNAPDPALGVLSGSGAFDPAVSHSGQLGNSTGPYVLNLLVQPAPTPPHVVSASPAEGAVLPGPPTRITVTFDAPVNLQDLAFQSYQQTEADQVAAVFIQDSQGNDYFPRLLSYDPATGQAVFQMVNALPNGSYALHLSGPLGLTDLGGNPLVGNDPSGDYVVHFSVQGAPRGSPGNPTAWFDQEPNDDPQHPQVLGPLFPVELSNTVTITRNAQTTAPVGGNDTADYFQISVLQRQYYLFALGSPSGLPPGAVPVLLDSAGNVIPTTPAGNGAVQAFLNPGTYVVGVAGWSAAAAPGVSYQLSISQQGSFEPATSLTTGPAPILRMRLAADSAPPPPPTPAPGGATAPVPPPVSLAAQPASLPGVVPVSVTVRADAGTAPTPTVLPPGTLLGLSEGPLGGRSAGSVAGPFLVEPPGVPGLNPGLVQAFISLTVATQTPAVGGDDSPAAPDQGPGLALIWRALKAVGEQAQVAFQAPANGPDQPAISLAGQMQAYLRTVDALFALYPRQPAAHAGPAADPGAPVATPGPDLPALSASPAEAPGWWASPVNLARWGAFAFCFAVATLRGRRQRARALATPPALPPAGGNGLQASGA